MQTILTRLILIMTATAAISNVALAQPSRLGITVEDYESPSGALVTYVRDGFPASQLRRADSEHTFFLVPGVHVVVAVNGTRVHSAQECIQEVLSAPQETTLRIYSRQRQATYEYFVTLNGDPIRDDGAGSGPDRSSTNWIPGRPHPSMPHVVAGASENDWVPAAGYRWARRHDGVRWAPHSRHPDHPHVIAGLFEGRWVPEPGYQWKDAKRMITEVDPDYGNSSGLDWGDDTTPSTTDSYQEPNWGWKFRQWDIQRDINRPYLPR